MFIVFGMKIHILSDLHVEFAPYHLEVLDADVIVLAGDIDVGMESVYWAKELINQTKAHIIFVAGNHEFYRENITKLRVEMNSFCQQAHLEGQQQRLHYLENSSVNIDGVRFLGATLWTDFLLFGEPLRKECMLHGEQSLNDFRLIDVDDGWKFTAKDSIALFNESAKWLQDELKHSSFDGKTVVITHHLPSARSVAERYKKNLLSACFASNLDHLMGYAELWVHGHTHDPFDYISNGTRVICNPRGYSKYNSDVENANFNPKLVVEI